MAKSARRIGIRHHPWLEIAGRFGKSASPRANRPRRRHSVVAKAVTPKRSDKVWEIELAPLTRVQAWKVPEIKPAMTVALLGFTFKDEKGEAILRAEYLWLNSMTYALRSNPA